MSCRYIETFGLSLLHGENFVKLQSFDARQGSNTIIIKYYLNIILRIIYQSSANLIDECFLLRIHFISAASPFYFSALNLIFGLFRRSFIMIQPFEYFIFISLQ